MRLKDKVALVTGSTRGIGRAIAGAFASEGAKVVVTGRTEDAGRDVAAQIMEAGGDAVYVRTDVSREDDVRNAVGAAVDAFGGLHILVNNAAPTDLVGPGRMDGPVGDISGEAWDAILSVALKSVLYACKHAIPEMARSGGGAIVNISSGASLLGVAGIDAYTASKAAINALTRSIAVEYASQQIRCNAIVVGMVLSSPGAHHMVADPQLGPAIRAIHLTRLGMPEDVAHAAVYLASDEAAFVTGVLLPVDGGVTCKMNVPNISAARIDLG